MAVMLARGDLNLDANTASVHEATAALLAVAPETRWMRDPTRGGVASACNELAVASKRGRLPVRGGLPRATPGFGTCELLNLDPST